MRGGREAVQRRSHKLRKRPGTETKQKQEVKETRSEGGGGAGAAVRIHKRLCAHTRAGIVAERGGKMGGRALKEAQIAGMWKEQERHMHRERERERDTHEMRRRAHR